MPVRTAINELVQVVQMLDPVSTPTLGVESGTFDARDYAHGSRFLAVFSFGVQTEGTLTCTVVDCDTSGGTYAATTEVYGDAVVVTTANDVQSHTLAFVPNPARPFIKLKSVETVSVTTAIPVAFSILVLPPVA